MGEQLGRVLRRYRQAKELTQQQVANQLGVKKATVSHYENGRNEPDITTLQRLADIYGATVNDFLMHTYLVSPSPPIQDERQNKIFDMIDDVINDANHLGDITGEHSETHELTATLSRYLGDSFQQLFPNLTLEEQDDFLNDIRLLWEIRYAKRQGQTEMRM